MAPAIEPYDCTFQPAATSCAPTVDLRPMIAKLGLSVREQAPRGTCSVFAVTFALEYLYGTRLVTGVDDLSEEYVNHAGNLAAGESVDGGFFSHLSGGYQTYGIVPEATVPYQSSQITTLDQKILDEGKRWSRFVADFVKPWDAATGATQAQLDKAVTYLDQDTPVCIGAWWPDSATYGTQQINGVEVMTTPPASKKGSGMFDGHSVVLVGYRRDSAFPGGGYFVFRNSWGQSWGDEGYGYMSFQYVLTYANDLLAFRTKSVKAKPGTRVGVTKTASSLDVFVTDETGEVHTAAWEAGVHGGKWRGWWSVLGGRGLAGAPVHAVSRSLGKYDVFVSGTDGRTYTAARDLAVANGQWGGWWNVLTGHIPAGGAVTAISRAPDKLDVFLVSNDGGVYTAAWKQGSPWGGWWRIGTLVAKPGTPVAVVSRDPNKLDIFVSGSDGKTYTAAWDAAVAGGWRGWWNILSGFVPAGGAVTAVSRGPDKLDVFLVSNDGAVYTAAWQQGVNDSKWQGWWKVT